MAVFPPNPDSVPSRDGNPVPCLKPGIFRFRLPCSFGLHPKNRAAHRCHVLGTALCSPQARSWADLSLASFTACLYAAYILTSGCDPNCSQPILPSALTRLTQRSGGRTSPHHPFPWWRTQGLPGCSPQSYCKGLRACRACGWEQGKSGTDNKTPWYIFALILLLRIKLRLKKPKWRKCRSNGMQQDYLCVVILYSLVIYPKEI